MHSQTASCRCVLNKLAATKLQQNRHMMLASTRSTMKAQVVKDDKSPFNIHHDKLLSLQEFVSLLGVEEKYHQSNKKLQLGTAGHSRCNIVACPCCTGQESDSSMGKLDSCHDLQHQQRETELAVAVESVLREVGEDPEREVGNLTSYLSFEEELQCIWMASCFRLCQSLIH